jgi:hypothetical protein
MTKMASIAVTVLPVLDSPKSSAQVVGFDSFWGYL